VIKVQKERNQANEANATAVILLLPSINTNRKPTRAAAAQKTKAISAIKNKITNQINTITQVLTGINTQITLITAIKKTKAIPITPHTKIIASTRGTITKPQHQSAAPQKPLTMESTITKCTRNRILSHLCFSKAATKSQI
jgi:hypothetical protein